MAEQTTEENKVEQASIEKSASTAGKKAISSAPSRKGKTGSSPLLWVLSGFSFIAVLVFSIGGYLGWQYWGEWQKQQLVNAEQQQLLLQNQLATATSLLKKEQAKELQYVSDKFALLEAKNNENNQFLQQISGQRPNDWLLAEADYLVRMAGRKLWLEHDVATSIMMLQSADSRLMDIADPSLIPVREKIAKDIQVLKQVNTVDTTSLALNISGLVLQIDQLPLAMVSLPDTDGEEEDHQLSQDLDDWQTNLRKSWRQFVDDFITVRRRTDSVEPLMSQQQQWFTRQQLAHYLLQAQLATLREQPQLYSTFLQLATESLNKHFKQSSPLVVNFSKSLSSLVAIDIKRTYPDILESARPLQDILQVRVENAFSNPAVKQ